MRLIWGQGIVQRNECYDFRCEDGLSWLQCLIDITQMTSQALVAIMVNSITKSNIVIICQFKYDIMFIFQFNLYFNIYPTLLYDL